MQFFNKEMPQIDRKKSKNSKFQSFDNFSDCEKFHELDGFITSRQFIMLCSAHLKGKLRSFPGKTKPQNDPKVSKNPKISNPLKRVRGLGVGIQQRPVSTRRFWKDIWFLRKVPQTDSKVVKNQFFESL